MTEGKRNQKQAGSETKTFSVPFAVGEIKENIIIKTNKRSELSKEQIILQAFKFHSQGNILEAIKCYKYCINKDFNDYRVFSNYGVILKDLGKLQEAESSTRKAIELNPDFAEAHYNLGRIFKDLDKIQEAENSYRKALEINPNFAEANSNLGNILKDLGELKEAELSFCKAIEIKPDFAQAHSNLGNIFKVLGKLQEAETSYRKALELNPDLTEANWNISHILLKQKKFEEGWIKYNFRWKLENKKGFPIGERLITTKPEWSPNKKGRVLLWAEQGPGDQLLYLTLIPDFIDKVNKLIIKVDKRLIPLLKRSINSKDVKFIAKQDYINENQYDFHLALGSLPKYLRPTLESFKISKKLKLLVNKEKSDKFRKTIMSKKNKKIVGISWKSSSQINNNRSLSLEEFILGIYSPEICFVCLQYGEVKEEIKNIKNNYDINIYEFEEIDKFENIDDLTALASICDEIVSIENMTLFIAGGLCINSYILLTPNCIWYNGHKELKSDWYPSLNFVRQGNEANWNKALNSIKHQIKI